MAIYIAFLQGINVGGHNKIKMAKLKNIFQSIGCKRVQTYIQSGNVLFESEENAQTLRKRIEQEIAKVFSFKITVILRTSIELEQIIENCPFTEAVLKEVKVSTDVETFYVSILLEPPTQEGIKQVSAFQNEKEEFRMNGREVYLLLRDGVRNSKLANKLYKLNVPSTMRNWKTINKLNSLAEAMDV